MNNELVVIIIGLFALAVSPQQKRPATVPADCAAAWDMAHANPASGCSMPSPGWYKGLPPDAYQHDLKNYNDCLKSGQKAKQSWETTYTACMKRHGLLASEDNPSTISGYLTPDVLIKVLDVAAQKGWKPNKDSASKPFPKGRQHNAKGEPFREGDEQLSANCSQYFREIVRQFPGPRSTQWTDDNCNANCIILRIQNAASTPSGEWRKVNESDAQELADRGVLVEGVSYYPNGPGHLATVFPNSAGADMSKFPGNGPFVRDGNEHPMEQEVDDRLYAGTWGAIRASKAFNYERTPPSWYMWMASTK